jgi:hypothetical protein
MYGWMVKKNAFRILEGKSLGKQLPEKCILPRL